MDAYLDIIIYFCLGFIAGAITVLSIICLTGFGDETTCIVVTRPEDFNLADIQKIRDQLRGYS